MLSLLLLTLAAAPQGDQSYEDQLVAEVLTTKGLTLESAPQGKLIEQVVVTTEEIISPTLDPWPQFLNWIHVRSRESMVRREVLLEPGAVYDEDRARETERILRGLFIFAVAKVVAAQGEHGGVTLVVVTKDRWSLRFNSEFLYSGGVLQYLRLRPTEENFLGRNTQVSLDFILRRDVFQLGQAFTDRRGLGSDLTISENALLIFNRGTGALEGTVGSAFVGKPLLNLSQPWAFGVSGNWNVRRRRIFRGASVWQLPYPDDSASGGSVPYVYDVREGGGSASVTRSFGLTTKVNLTGAVGGYLHQYTPPPGGALTDEQRAWLVDNYLPRSENALYGYVSLSAYPVNYVTLRDIDSFQLTEDYHLGPFVSAAARWAVPTPWTSHFIEVGATVRYRWLLEGDLLTIGAAGVARAVPGKGIFNRHWALELSNVSPPFEGGRFVTRLYFEGLAYDLDHGRFLLGSESGLRGAPAESLSGTKKLLGNVEYRTRAFVWNTVVVGFVLFYDVGSAYDATVVLTHTMGIGTRILLPQVNQDVIRIDFGMVLGGDGRPGLDRFTATFGQVTDSHPGILDNPL
ncbi:MAG: hypothetical protein K1X89_15275 [Myxococcaceae bacterium]|nr:hypothetical protein [Myxococcaceae bacterium]